jgi:hypothetical protein
MACMCGDYCCPSCGPAQGNWKCPVCGEWASEGCKHIGVRSGKLLKRYEKAAARATKAENEYWEKYAKEFEKEEVI